MDHHESSQHVGLHLALNFNVNADNFQETISGNIS